MSLPSGLMKLLNAPESIMSLCQNFCLRTLLGSLANFLNCSSFLNFSLNADGWYCMSQNKLQGEFFYSFWGPETPQNGFYC